MILHGKPFCIAGPHKRFDFHDEKGWLSCAVSKLVAMMPAFMRLLFFHRTSGASRTFQTMPDLQCFSPWRREESHIAFPSFDGFRLPVPKIIRGNWKSSGETTRFRSGKMHWENSMNWMMRIRKLPGSQAAPLETTVNSFPPNYTHKTFSVCHFRIPYSDFLRYSAVMVPPCAAMSFGVPANTI